jgi:hypothetical protein
MIHFITEIIGVEKQTIICKFNNGELRRINLESTVKKFSVHSNSFLNKLSDEINFKNVKLDSYGTLSWNHEIDFCQDVLYSMSTSIN